ncbi:MAG: phosphoribosylanthranilate isomerase [Bacteroidales bacterium]|nr:phosphoribosylanthranilate isomerase [Bacteroidales bacterium]
MNSPLIKVCGMREGTNIQAVAEQARPDWMGFILWPGSKRYVDTVPSYMPPADVKRVGVFVDPTIEEVLQARQQFGLNLVQLHGKETPGFCLALKSAIAAEALPPLPIIKAFAISSTDDLAATSDYIRQDEGRASCTDAFKPADYFLFDTRTPLVGGSGQQFDWHILDAYTGSTPFLLSGGIGPEDAERLHTFQHPRCIGFDLNSRFETAPAMKDAEALAGFIRRVRQAGDLA